MKAFLLPCLFAFLACLAFSILCNVRGRALLTMPLGGSLGWLVYTLLLPHAAELSAYFFATIAVSVYAEIMARVHRAPTTGFLLIGLLPLVPGGGIYYTMEYCIGGELGRFLETGLHTFGIAGSLALGVLVVSSCMRLYASAAKRLERRRGTF